MEKRREILSDPKAVFFLEKKLAEYRQKLRETEEKLETFRRQYGFYSFNQQMDFLLKKKSDIEDSIAAGQDETQTLKQALPMLSGQPKIAREDFTPIDASSGDSDELKELRGKLLPLKLKEQELLTKYTEHNQFVVNVRNEIKGIESLIKKEEASLRKPKQSSNEQKGLTLPGLDEEKSGLEASISTAEAKVAGLKEDLTNCQKQINDLGSQEKKLNELAREKEHNEQYYKIYASKVEELRISEDVGRQEMPSITVLQAAIPSAKPVNKEFNIMIFFAVAAILGLGAGIVLAYLLEFMSQGLRTPEGVEARLGLPVLATVPWGA
jgi:uncharacterized protein involved in exopolysaccharide biosynthesis